MRIAIVILVILTLLQAEALTPNTIQDLYSKKRAEWISLRGTVRFNHGGKVSIIDSTGQAALKIARTSSSKKKEFLKSLKDGDTISIIGTHHRIDEIPTVRVLLAKQNETTLFRQEFRNISSTTLPASLADNEYNILAYQYRRSYQKKATTNLIIGSTAATISTMFYITMLTYEPDTGGFFPDLTGVVYFFCGAGFSITTIRHLTAGGLFKRRKKLAPEMDYKENPITFDVQIRSEREKLGLFFVGRF